MKMFRSPKSFLICDRNLIIEQIFGNSPSVYGFSDEDRRIAEIEADSKGFFTTNSSDEILWQINFEFGNLTFLNPIIGDFQIGIFN